MKNLLIFVDPAKEFNREHKTLVKIQIDWSLEMGWKPEDIMLVTNFPYEYREVKATLVEDDCYCPHRKETTKIPVINRLFEKGLIKEGEEYWFHDFDAFQFEKFPDINSFFAICDYGWVNKWNSGSFFFNSKAHHIFQEIETDAYKHCWDEERALTHMINSYGFKEYELLNITYCICIYHFEENCSKASKPIMVGHFHPVKPHHLKLFWDIIPISLKNIFKNYELETH